MACLKNISNMMDRKRHLLAMKNSMAKDLEIKEDIEDDIYHLDCCIKNDCVSIVEEILDDGDFPGIF